MALTRSQSLLLVRRRVLDQISTQARPVVQLRPSRYITFERMIFRLLINRMHRMKIWKKSKIWIPKRKASSSKVISEKINSCRTGLSIQDTTQSALLELTSMRYSNASGIRAAKASHASGTESNPSKVCISCFVPISCPKRDKVSVSRDWEPRVCVIWRVFM